MNATANAPSAPGIIDKHAKNQQDFLKIAEIIKENLADLRKPGVLFAGPGYKHRNGLSTAQPAVVVTVGNKRDVAPDMQLPASLGGYPVDVRQATMLERIHAQDPARYARLAASVRPEHKLPKVEGELHVASGQATKETLEAGAVPQKLRLDYVPADVPLDALEGEMSIVCHAGPDAAWLQLKQFLAGVQLRLTVGLYDFTSAHILQELECDLAARGATLQLTLDDPKKDPTADQTDPETVDSLAKNLGTSFRHSWAPVNTSPMARAAIFPTAYHIKVAVADGQRTWLSSGNWDNCNQPDIDPFNDRKAADEEAQDSERDWHVIVNSPALAGVFEAYLKQDFDSASEAARAAPPLTAVAQAAQLTDDESNTIALETLVPGKAPSIYFPPQRIPETGTRRIKIQPLLTPDVGVYTSHVLQLIQSGTSKLYMQTQYIHPPDRPEDQKFADLIDALIERRQAGIDVRIILSQFQLGKWQDRLAQTGMPMDIVRVQHAVHNKGIVVDGHTVMVSSQNWSPDGVLRNRDAGVIIFNADAAQYFEQIFLHDWTNLATPISEFGSGTV